MNEENQELLKPLFPGAKQTDPRPSWDDYFMEITGIVAKRSTCLRRKVGAVIVKDKHILTSGYNGAPRNIKNCLEHGYCLKEEKGFGSGEGHSMCIGLHAEQNAIIQAAYHGINISGSTLYCLFLPCSICLKMLINAGINRIVFKKYYPDDLSLRLLKESKMELTLYREKEKEQEKQSSD